MRTEGCTAWLEQREPPLKLSTVKTYVRDAKRIEKHYGDLDDPQVPRVPGYALIRGHAPPKQPR